MGDFCKIGFLGLGNMGGGMAARGVEGQGQVRGGRGKRGGH